MNYATSGCLRELLPILQALSEDLRFYHKLRFPGQQATYLSCVQILLSSKGLFVLTAQRLFNKHSYLSTYGPVGCMLKNLMRVMVGLGWYLSKVLVKCQFISTTVIEAGVFLSNKGHVILGLSSIGSGTIIHDRVTFGMDLESKAVPMIGRNVWIGPHCVIYGNIEIADGVTVLPNSVVSKSLPPGALVNGNPAVIIKRSFDNSKFRSTLSTEVSLVLDENIRSQLLPIALR